MFYALDICGTLVFAVAGAFRATRHELDLLGVLVLALATGVGGGILRDMMLGATPPAAFQDEAYLAACLLGGALVLVVAPRIARHWNMVMVADALGLGLFTAIGAAKAAAYGLGPIGMMMMGALTATGGGVVRDLLVREVPAVIRHDFYATAALLGGACLAWTAHLGLPEPVQLGTACVVTTGLRLYAMIFKVNLPRVRRLPEPANPSPDRP